MTKEELLQIPFYIEDISGSENTVSITKNNTGAPTLNLEYSTDGITWTTRTMNSSTTANTFTIPANGKIYFRGVNERWGGSSSTTTYYNIIRCSGNYNVGGNIMSLLYGSNFIDKTSFPTTSSYVLGGLFMNNYNLVNAKDLQLPATTLANHCYDNMFYGCTIITAPELPATTLAGSCYESMFIRCRRLTTAPELPATTLAEYCYSEMFKDCSSLITAPELPATTLPVHCYSGMFSGCSSLTIAPELPATTLDMVCYGGMFRNCTSLTTAPSILPATTLANNCYSSMFSGCTSLTTAPELPATKLTTQCYSNMFNGCSKLNYIKADFINYGSSYLTSWVQGVSSTGTFIMNHDANYNPEEIRGVDGIPSGWYADDLWYDITTTSLNGTIIGIGEYPLDSQIILTAVPNLGYKFVQWEDGDTSNPREITVTEDKTYTATFEESLGCLMFRNNSTTSNTILLTGGNCNLEYSIDGTNFNPVTFNTKIDFHIAFYLRGNNNINLDGCRIKCTKPYSIGGNLTTLLYGEEYETKDNIIPEDSINTFKNLFLGNTNLTDISQVIFPDNTVKGCYQHMFTGCKSLKTIPELPAQNLTDSCYHGMFMDCDGINTVTLPEAYLAPYAYSNMFLGSDNLSKVTVTYREDVEMNHYKGWLDGVSVNGKFNYNHTEEVDSSIIKTNYYVPGSWEINYFDPTAINYFYIEDISGEPNVFSINKMEQGATAPELNLEYSTDTQNWVVLEGNSIDIPANSKVYLKGNNDGTGVINTEDGSIGVNTFTCSGQYNVGGNIMSLLYSDECMDKNTLTNAGAFLGLFAESTTLVNAQDLQLPATTLSDFCYMTMFGACISLTTAPSILPATTLAIGCYCQMFAYCTSLTTAPELPATTLAEGCYQFMFSNCSSLNYIKADFVDYSNTNGKFGYWVQGVAEEGTFVMNPNANYNPEEIRGVDGIPEGWTVLTSEEQTVEE